MRFSNNRKEIPRDFLLDLVLIFPYVVIDTILYFSTGSEFLDKMIDGDNERISSDKYLHPAYLVFIAAVVILFLTYFSTFSLTSSKFLNRKLNSTYSSSLEKMRLYLGIPSAMIKSFIASTSVYLLMNKSLDKNASLALSVGSFVFSFPSMLSLLWSEHKSDSVRNLSISRKINNKFLYAIIHFFSLCYSADNNSLYLWSLINSPKKIGVSDHGLHEYQNGLERVLFALCFIPTLFSLLAVYISYVHLNENMFGLVKDEPRAWTNTKKSLKKYTGLVSAVTKVANAGITTFGFFSKYSKGLALTTAVVGPISGLLVQASILYSNPVKQSVPVRALREDGTASGVVLADAPVSVAENEAKELVIFSDRKDYRSDSRTLIHKI